ncbi:hypothetical protein WDV06_29910 [Streptomyces racemochromogenes]|uniref:Transmembrane protein n=1 Tax=Streptomyces racemochromogenes TaxID=67353 RepID=A0ABW7PMM7_9ACTN
MNTIHPAVAATACTAPSLASLALSFLPWALLVILAGVIMGGVIGWISHRAGDTPWEALRQGLMASVSWVGPLLAVLLFVINLVSQCR